MWRLRRTGDLAEVDLGQFYCITDSDNTLRSHCIYDYTVGPLNKTSVVTYVRKNATCSPKNFGCNVATFKFSVIAICGKIIKIVKPVELHAGNNSRDKFYRAAFII